MGRFTLVWSCDTNLATLQQGQKWMTSWPNHVLYISCPSANLFSFVASFIVFDLLEFSLNWFFTLIAFDKKRNAVPMQTRVIFFWPGKNKLHHRKARVYKTICFLDCLRSLVCCFDSGPWVASFVRMRHDMLLLHNSWLWDDNRGNSYISLVIFWLH